MQSSFTVFCRALVMLTCLVVLLLAAVTGGTGRKVIVPLVERCLDVLRERPVEPAGHALSPAPLTAAPSGGKWAGGTANGVYPGRGGGDQSRKQSGSTLPISESQEPRRGEYISGSIAQSEPAVLSDGRSRDSSQAPAAHSRRVIEQRLRDLGATYYTLEKWGNSQRLYRFECRMAITTDPNYTRFFEATSERPLGAMEHVLAEVEAWRADRQVR